MSVIYGSPVNLGGGGKVPADLPPLLPNFALEFSGTTVTVTANKLPLNDKTSMLAGGVWVLASTIPDSPKGAIVQQWTADDLLDATQTESSEEVVTWTYPNWSAGEPIYCRQYTYNEKGQYNTSLYGGLVSTEDAPPFQLPEFTGNHAIFGDETAGRIELYESGELTLSPGTYDIFMVGGGGSYSGVYSTDYLVRAGGGSGYTTTETGVEISSTSILSAVVGAGGSTIGKDGSETSIRDSSLSINMSSAGGKANGSGRYDGAPGGSGGGASDSGKGGSDGSDGGSTSYGTGGAGQGTTTRAFSEPDGVLYAGGGTSGGVNTKGGDGGGGKGSTTATAYAGTPNTGGGSGGNVSKSSNASGGGGGSGIIIIRWNNA